MGVRIALSLVAVGVATSLALIAHADAPAGRYTTINGAVYPTNA